MYQIEPPLSPKETLPTMYDLPSEDPEEPGLPDEFHDFQPEILRQTFRPTNYPYDRVFVGSDLNLYYDVRHTSWYKRPDWFAVVGVDRFYEKRDLRMSYVIWQEGVNPFIVVELLSPGTEKEDLGKTLRDVNKPPTKWEVYEQILRIPYYVVFDRLTNNLRIFQLQGGHYEELTLTEPRLWIPEINLGLGLWYGSYQGIERHWLRWFYSKNNWVLFAEEELEQEKQRAEAEKQRAEAERQRAEAEKQRADRLAAQLRALGVELDEE
ncbi:MAG: Uma2 family endonuclease [Gomphosphaeria aponina SAG 52.96 = DSM 107014]|uniref:Uma2 family endonuclease n=1 Tax=Gomphosphaeria aponina SAG 52.96 = DSM 107014 TaxID=1521640 RepID=A0A941JQ22_9CHRO|nr:Uma2 family endonuclease [Gomphosphaeria aponina SAG 52.96 = DSM 107014]